MNIKSIFAVWCSVMVAGCASSADYFCFDDSPIKTTYREFPGASISITRIESADLIDYKVLVEPEIEGAQLNSISAAIVENELVKFVAPLPIQSDLDDAGRKLGSFFYVAPELERHVSFSATYEVTEPRSACGSDKLVENRHYRIEHIHNKALNSQAAPAGSPKSGAH